MKVYEDLAKDPEALKDVIYGALITKPEYSCGTCPAFEFCTGEDNDCEKTIKEWLMSEVKDQGQCNTPT